MKESTESNILVLVATFSTSNHHDMTTIRNDRNRPSRRVNRQESLALSLWAIEQSLLMRPDRAEPPIVPPSAQRTDRGKTIRRNWRDPKTGPDLGRFYLIDAIEKVNKHLGTKLMACDDVIRMEEIE